MCLSSLRLEMSLLNLCLSKLEEASILSSLGPMAVVKVPSSEFLVDFGPYLVVSSKDQAYKSSFISLKDLTCPQVLSEIR
jgi:hypothetical protein